MVNGGAGAPIEEIGSCGERLGPVFGWHVSVDEEGAAYIVQRTEDAFSLAVLRGVRARES